MGSSHSTAVQDIDTPKSESPQEDVYFPRNTDDALLTYNTLRHLLPTELVLEILGFAQYWLQSKAFKDTECHYKEAHCRPRQPYLISDPIPEGRLEEIRINIWSHDQGWSSYREDHGTYRNSWTWFELTAEGPGGRKVITEGEDLRLTCNVHAKKEATHHEIIFRRHEDLRLMQALQAGDLISIVPMARYAGWMNTVEKASIEVFTAPIL
ncbi:unnamed protein product [Penicillium olsonii]|nr:unnamed protein product [Penicillium olsonii]